ncbi:MAG: GIY-YIG nuclease family protein, partial [Dehalococcoidia bacterium]
SVDSATGELKTVAELVEGSSGARWFEMVFCVYMLRCSDDSIYVGHTDNVDVRLAAHRSRVFSGHTAKRLPVTLIFAEQFGSRDQAFAAERQIKGWARSKKLALARGDYDLLIQLAAIRSPERRLA